MNEMEKNAAPPVDPPRRTDTGGAKPLFSLLNTAFEIGYTIVLPLVFFAFLGRFADKFFGTAPWLLFLGILLALLSSSRLIYKKVKSVLR